jgi:hypothetical protein
MPSDPAGSLYLERLHSIELASQGNTPVQRQRQLHQYEDDDDVNIFMAGGRTTQYGQGPHQRTLSSDSVASSLIFGPPLTFFNTTNALNNVAMAATSNAAFSQPNTSTPIVRNNLTAQELSTLTEASSQQETGQTSEQATTASNSSVLPGATKPMFTRTLGNATDSSHIESTTNTNTFPAARLPPLSDINMYHPFSELEHKEAPENSYHSGGNSGSGMDKHAATNTQDDGRSSHAGHDDDDNVFALLNEASNMIGVR